MPRLTVAHLRRTLTPGTKIRIVNHKRPAASRDTSVHPKTNTVDLVTWATTIDGGVAVASHTAWPKPGELRADDDDPTTFHIDQQATDSFGKVEGVTLPFLTITVMPDDTPDWPTTSRPLPAADPANA